MKENGVERPEKVLGFKFGQMVLNTRGSGKIIKLTVKENFGM